MISISIEKKELSIFINVGNTSFFIIMKFSVLLAALLFSSGDSTFIPCTTICANPLSSTQCVANSFQTIGGFGNARLLANPLYLNQ
jgi:hypothetical protein